VILLAPCTLYGMEPEGRITATTKGEADMVATWIRTIFTMGTPGAVRAQLDHVADTLRTVTHGWPKCCVMRRPT
jgi:hypothetical protein